MRREMLNFPILLWPPAASLALGAGVGAQFRDGFVPAHRMKEWMHPSNRYQPALDPSRTVACRA